MLLNKYKRAHCLRGVVLEGSSVCARGIMCCVEGEAKDKAALKSDIEEIKQLVSKVMGEEPAPKQRGEEPAPRQR